MGHKAGFVNIIGNPNVGKSTLMNALVGENLSIITSKAQTTRHRIQGIVNGEDFQIVYSDTPGIIKPHHELQKSMMKYVSTALEDADLILYVTDVVEAIDKHEEYIKRLKGQEIPVFLILNKTDLTSSDKVAAMLLEWQERLPNALLFPVSALKGKNLGGLLKEIIKYLPENPPYYPKDELTDRSERFFVSEIIREKILLNYQKEVPYSVEVDIELFKELEKIINIQATIYVTRDSQKGILIGKKGSMLKKTGTEARVDIEKFLGKKVFLELYVKVRKDWRNNPNQVKRFGYGR